MSLSVVSDIVETNHPGIPWEVCFMAKDGASGPKILGIQFAKPVEFNGHKPVRRVALKYGETRIPIHQQCLNYAIIQPFLSGHLPMIYAHGEIGQSRIGWMEMEFISEFNLHDAVIEQHLPDSVLTQTVEDVLNSFVDMWKKSSTEGFNPKECPRNPIARAKRIQKHLATSDIIINDQGTKLMNCVDVPIVVNGKEYPSLMQTLGAIDYYSPPTISVTCHGDPNADNIMPNGNTWWLTDFEWCGENHDWRMMASHLFGWWTSNALHLFNEPQVSLRRDALIVNYQADLSPICKDIQDNVLQKCHTMAEFSGDTSWKKQFNRFLSLLYLGDLRFVEARGRKHYTGPLIGEGVRATHDLN